MIWKEYLSHWHIEATLTTLIKDLKTAGNDPKSYVQVSLIPVKLKTNARIILLFCLCYGKNHHERNISSSDIIKQLQIHKLMVWIPKKTAKKCPKTAKYGQ